ncbi:MAG: 2-dehydropantoate 2-reductase [Desulfarculales bacterium]|jgi:2-dehydropantoate 2-reductase|nr:2-dehydropantoate 2-reductase [Desulfarculales bacterium]
MKICIIGAGAMGVLFGALLREAGHQVGLVASRQVYLDALERNRGIVVEKDGIRRAVACPISLDSRDFTPSELVIVFVKAPATEQVASQAGLCAGKNGLVLSLQNGLGNAELLARHIDPDRIMAGYTSQAALLLEPGVIRHTGSGPSALGSWSGGNKAEALALASMFSQAGIATRTEEDVPAVIWDKIFVNVGINAVGALAGITNGQVVDMEPSRRLARQALDEAVSVARRLGVGIRPDVWEHLLHIGHMSSQNRCSMWQDLKNHKITEIEFIHGAVSRLGREHNIPTPINSALADLIRAAQSNYL